MMGSAIDLHGMRVSFRETLDLEEVSLSNFHAATQISSLSMLQAFRYPPEYLGLQHHSDSDIFNLIPLGHD